MQLLKVFVLFLLCENAAGVRGTPNIRGGEVSQRDSVEDSNDSYEFILQRQQEEIQETIEQQQEDQKNRLREGNSSWVSVTQCFAVSLRVNVASCEDKSDITVLPLILSHFFFLFTCYLNPGNL